jgi:Flp pilus assembly protein TadB
MTTGDSTTNTTSEGETGAATLSAATPNRGKLSPEAAAAARHRRRTRRVKRGWKRFLLRLTGWGCIFLGILGIFLPILQGILFLLIGLYILGRVSPRTRLWRMRLRRRARERYPWLTGKFEEAEVKAKYWVNRILKTNNKKKA